MLACHIEWHMRERLRPMLFDDDDPTAAARERTSIVAPAQPSPAALRKRASKLTANGAPVHSFQSLLRDLATCTLNEMTTPLNDAYSFTLVATPTPIVWLAGAVTLGLPLTVIAVAPVPLFPRLSVTL